MNIEYRTRNDELKNTGSLSSFKLLCLLFVIFLVSSTFPSYSQSDAYSQFYNSKLTLNPAYTGLTEGRWRISELYQNQIIHDSLSITTNSLFADKARKFVKTAGRYGMVVATESRFMMGWGALYEFRKSSRKELDYQSLYVSFGFHQRYTKACLSFGIQPGLMKINNSYKFGLHAGAMFGYVKPECWIGDQLYKYQAGVSVYNALQGFRNSADTLIVPSRKIQGHAGVIIEIKQIIGLVPAAHYVYTGDHYYNGGFTIVWLKHFLMADRLRAGIQYKSTNHITYLAGIRLFTLGKEAYAFDFCASRDIPLDDVNCPGDYFDGTELHLIIYPLRKCWSLGKCKE